jgi:hypothetical protein
MKQVNQHAKDLAAIVHQAFSRPAVSFLGSFRLVQHCGIHQGDPASMPLFCLGFMPLVKKLNHDHSYVTGFAYADDLVCHVPRNDCEALLRFLKIHGASHGIVFNNEKLRTLDIIKTWDENVTFLGVPVFSPDDDTTMRFRRVQSIATPIIDRLKLLNDTIRDPEAKMQLLMKSFGFPAVCYFLRAIAPSDFSPTGSIADESNGNLLYQIYDKVLACVLAVCSPDKPVSRSFVLDERAVARIGLPISDTGSSGLGIRNPQDHALAAFIILRKN